jgi:hypothetical protein
MPPVVHAVHRHQEIVYELAIAEVRFRRKLSFDSRTKISWPVVHLPEPGGGVSSGHQGLKQNSSYGCCIVAEASRQTLDPVGYSCCQLKRRRT